MNVIMRTFNEIVLNQPLEVKFHVNAHQFQIKNEKTDRGIA